MIARREADQARAAQQAEEGQRGERWDTGSGDRWGDAYDYRGWSSSSSWGAGRWIRDYDDSYQQGRSDWGGSSGSWQQRPRRWVWVEE